MERAGLAGGMENAGPEQGRVNAEPVEDREADRRTAVLHRRSSLGSTWWLRLLVPCLEL